jgi:hypothetical protein
MHADDQAVAIAYEDPTRAFSDLARTYLSRHVANAHDDLGNPSARRSSTRRRPRGGTDTPVRDSTLLATYAPATLGDQGAARRPDDEHDPPPRPDRGLP